MCGHRYDRADELQITSLRAGDVYSLIAVRFINCLSHDSPNVRKALGFGCCVGLN